MKKIFPLVFSASVLLVSCKKSSSDNSTNPNNPSGTYYLNCTINGADKKFTPAAIVDTATQPAPSGNYYTWGIAVSGTIPSSDSIRQCGFTISGAIYKGNLHGQLTDLLRTYNIVGDSNTVVEGYDETYYGGVAYSAFSGTNLSLSATGKSNPFQITITAIDSKTIKGTFSGVIVNDDASRAAASYELITNGSFYMLYTNR